MRPNVLIATVGILVAILVCIQAAWLVNVNTRNKEALDLRTAQAVNGAAGQIEESVTCVQLFTKYHISEGEGFYISKQKWDESGFTGGPGMVDMYYDFSEFRGDTTGMNIPYKYGSFKATYPADVEVLLKIHFLPGTNNKGFDEVSSKISRDNFRELVTTGNRLEKIVSTADIDSIISAGLKKESIETSYGFALLSAKDSTIAIAERVSDTSKLISTGISARLFTNDKFIPDYLLVVLPAKQGGLYGVSSLMLLSVVIITLLTYSFYVFTRLYKNQARISKMKTDFINNLTHEFNTPMANISLALETIREQDLEVNDRLKHILSIISAESVRLRDNIEQALHVATLEKDKLVLRKEPVNMRELVIAIEPAYTLKTEQHHGELKIDMQGECVVLGDETHLLNCICNLLDNAIKYRRDQPELLLSLKETEKYVVLKVKDNGIGISVEKQQKIFDLFYRAEEGDIHDTKGFGLGLSYVKGIVETTGGSISVDSKVGKGSVFTIKIPKLRK